MTEVTSGPMTEVASGRMTEVASGPMTEVASGPMIKMTSGRIWATRPTDQNRAWAQALAQFNKPIIDCSLLHIEPVHEPETLQAVKNLILDFDQFNKVIFVSQNAVREAFKWLHDYWPQLPAHQDYFAIGQKTAEAAILQGIQVAHGHLGMDTQELLTHPALQNVWGQKILICRGLGGLPTLGIELQNRGAIVRYCELYRRLMPEQAIHIAQEFIQAHLEHDQERLELDHARLELDIVPIFSGETLNNWNHILQRFNITQKNMTLIVPGKRVAQKAAQLGFTQVIMAENASTPSMIKAVEHCLARLTP